MMFARNKGIKNKMRFFEYVESLDCVISVNELRIIYKHINEKYDDLLRTEVEPTNRNYHRWINLLNTLKESEDLILECLERDCVNELDWLRIKCSLYKFQVKYGGLKSIKVEDE